jgi:hypothetical protein
MQIAGPHFLFFGACPSDAIVIASAAKQPSTMHEALDCRGASLLATMS